MAKVIACSPDTDQQQSNYNLNHDYFSLSRGMLYFRVLDRSAVSSSTGEISPSFTPLPYLTPAAHIPETPFFSPRLHIPATPNHRAGRVLAPHIQPSINRTSVNSGSASKSFCTTTSTNGPSSTSVPAPPPAIGSEVPTSASTPVPMQLSLPSPKPTQTGASLTPLPIPIPRNMVNQTSPRPSSIAGSVTPNARPSQASATSARNILIFQPDQLADLLRGHTSSSHAVLGLDMRSFQQYSEHRIIDSVNVSIPTTLLRRPAFTPVKMFGSVSSDHAKHVLKDWTSYQNIVVIDADSTIAYDASPLKLLASKLLLHANTNTKIGWLMGGYAAFAEMHPDLCDASPPPAGSGGIAPAANEATKGMCLSDLAGPLTAPSALGALGAGRPTLLQPTYAAHTSVASLSQNDTLIGAVDIEDRELLPRFLKDLLESGNVRAQIESNFTAVEAAEKKRLDCSFRARSRTDPFSVSDALEGGATRNRYNNIWPFNHNRVKLSCKKLLANPLLPTVTSPAAGLATPKACTAEQQMMSNDYINASHIISPAGHRRYIATQGPIASTFDDFWRMAWQEKSRIVLMLVADADVQQGSQTCHKYWPSEGSSQTFGRVRVSHIRERQVPFEAERDPDAGGGVILREFVVVVDGDESQARSIWQVQYLGWPDHGVPKHADEMLQVHHLVSKLCARLDHAYGKEDVGPVIVHCSAGCGRTGAFICIDAVLSALHSLGAIPSVSSLGLSLSPTSIASSSSFMSITRCEHHPGILGQPHQQQQSQQSHDVLPSAVTATRSAPGTPGADTWSTVRPILTPNTFGPASSPHDMILAAVHHLRSQRVLMVQSLSQFAFCYEVVARYCAVAGVPSSKSSKSAGAMQDTTASAFVLPLAALSPSELDQSDYGETMQRYNCIVGADAVDATLAAFPNIAHPPDLEQTSDDDDETEARKRERAVSLEEMVVQQRTSRTRC
ncbi:hypothetical protein PhCBS80983_g04398 [Powellomyces hirtus]|uniref:protein-tyrosine-phosphatase n=1 Tax=Powellomyces hirtus TaxID=109895 RepID=A0A507DXZ2_9FUNG|nr:hypothetical protein PhCBS80983_g04398 [Powellomyces hirtus]